MARKKEPADDLMLVRATANLQGLGCGEEAWVDPLSPYIRGALRAQMIVPVEPDKQPMEGGS
jgi:hypothetical protein